MTDDEGRVTVLLKAICAGDGTAEQELLPLVYQELHRLVCRFANVLKARGLVGVRGAGMAYDGLYYVKSVTHSIKPGEYKQSFQLARNGLISLLPAVVP